MRAEGRENPYLYSIRDVARRYKQRRFLLNAALWTWLLASCIPVRSLQPGGALGSRVCRGGGNAGEWPDSSARSLDIFAVRTVILLSVVSKAIWCVLLLSPVVYGLFSVCWVLVQERACR